MTEAIKRHCTGEVKDTATEALVSGQVTQVEDGRAGVVLGLKSAASGDAVTFATEGVFDVSKGTAVFLPGSEVWWDATNNRAAVKGQGDFYVGVAVADAATGASTVKTDLNVRPSYDVALGQNAFTLTETNGLGVVGLPGGGAKLAFDAVAEAAIASFISKDGIDADEGPIARFYFAVNANGDDAALDIDLGLTSLTAGNADFESGTAHVAVHLDGNTLDLDAHSDDGTTDVAPVDTTVNLVLDTYVLVEIDARNKSSVAIYVDGARVNSGTTFTLAAYSADLYLTAHVEKSSNDTVAEVRVLSASMHAAGRSA